MLSPGVFGVELSLDCANIVRLYMRKEVADPFDVLLNTSGNVAEGRSIVRSYDGEQVGETFYLDTEKGARSIGPLILKDRPRVRGNQCGRMRREPRRIPLRR